MDSAALDNLLTAKILLATATQLSLTGERHSCTAGSMNLLDAFELVLLACLAEKKITPKEHVKLDQLILHIESADLTVPNKTKVLGLTRSRGGSKHFGNTIDQYALKDFLKYTTETIEYLVATVFKKPYYEIYSTELVQHPESKVLLEQVAQSLEMDSFDPYECLINIRKAIYINFEEEYSIEEWKEHDNEQPFSLIESLLYKHKAPFYTRNKEWIEKNVTNVFDYIQIDVDQLSIKLMEYGIAPPIFFNLRRLTPKVFRYKGSNNWKRAGNFAFVNTSKETVRYCLSTSVEMILLKENYDALHRPPPEELKMQIQAVQPTFLYKKASITSEKLLSIESGEIFLTNAFVPGFEDKSLFIATTKFREESKPKWLRGYIPADHVDRYEPPKDASNNIHTSPIAIDSEQIPAQKQ